jgi:hypothetical protein
MRKEMLGTSACTVACSSHRQEWLATIPKACHVACFPGTRNMFFGVLGLHSQYDKELWKSKLAFRDAEKLLARRNAKDFGLFYVARCN